jgi:hypothetical protein
MTLPFTKLRGGPPACTARGVSLGAAPCPSCPHRPRRQPWCRPLPPCAHSPRLTARGLNLDAAPCNLGIHSPRRRPWRRLLHPLRPRPAASALRPPPAPSAPTARGVNLDAASCTLCTHSPRRRPWARLLHPLHSHSLTIRTTCRSELLQVVRSVLVGHSHRGRSRRSRHLRHVWKRLKS